MRPRPAVTALLPLALVAGAAAAPAVYDLDPEHTFVHFEVRHFDTSTVRGRFGPVRGEVVLDAEAGEGRIGIVVDTGTLATGFAPLDARLRRADLLDIAGHPQAWFSATRLRFDGARLAELRGELTLRGTGVPLTLRATRFGCLAGVPQRCGGDFEGELRRSEVGATFGLPFVADQVRLRVQVEGLRRE